MLLHFDRHLDDMRRKHESAGDLKQSLDAQVAAVRDRHLMEEQQEASEIQRMQQHWARLQVGCSEVKVELLLRLQPWPRYSSDSSSTAP